MGGVDYRAIEFAVDHNQAKSGNVTLFSRQQNFSSSKLAKLTQSLKNRFSAQARTPSSAVSDNLVLKRFMNGFLTLIIIASLIVGAVLFVPSLYYSVFPADVIEVQAPEPGTAFGGDFKSPAIQEPKKEKYQPPVDPTLPKGDWMIIPRIGVHSEMRPTPTAEEALSSGLWWVPDFGIPGDEDLPIIVAGHRYGWKWWWKDDYWKYNSFYLLPETEPGDRIEIISNQQKWVYEIYAGEVGDEITDYNADLIIYTCQYLSGPIRHFRYARLIDPTTDTQNTQVSPQLN